MCSPSSLEPIRLSRPVGFANTSSRLKQAHEAIMEDIAEVVHHFILREFLPGEDPEELTSRTPLITGGILDSISTLKLVVFLEEQFGITIEAFEAGVEHLDSIGQIAELVGRKQKNAA
jgi:acyl carrier protein